MQTPRSQPCRKYSPTKAFQRCASRTTVHRFSPEKWNSSPKAVGTITTTLLQNGPERTNSRALQSEHERSSANSNSGRELLEIRIPKVSTDVPIHTAQRNCCQSTCCNEWRERDVLPLMTPTDHVVDRTRDQEYKDKMGNGPRPHKFRVGDGVIVKQTKTNKLTPTYNPTPLKITEARGSRITAQEINGSWAVTKDAFYFRKIQVDALADNADEDDASGENKGETENENASTDTLQKRKQQEMPNTEEAQRPRRTTRMPSYLKNHGI